MPRTTGVAWWLNTLRFMELEEWLSHAHLHAECGHLHMYTFMVSQVSHGEGGAGSEPEPEPFPGKPLRSSNTESTRPFHARRDARSDQKNDALLQLFVLLQQLPRHLSRLSSRLRISGPCEVKKARHGILNSSMNRLRGHHLCSRLHIYVFCSFASSPLIYDDPGGILPLLSLLGLWGHHLRSRLRSENRCSV